GLGLLALGRAEPPAGKDEQPVVAEPPARRDEPPADPEGPGFGKFVVALGQKKFRFRSYLLRIAYSPDGKLLAVSDADTIRLFDATTKQELRTWEGSPGIGIKSLAFSPDSKVLATADQSPKVRLWDVATGKIHLEFVAHRSGAHFVVFSPDGNLLATTGEDRDPRRRDLLDTNEYSVRVWDAKTGKESAVFQPAVIDENCVAF